MTTKLFLTLALTATLSSCDKESKTKEPSNAATEALSKLYPNARNIQWSEKLGYQVAKFSNKLLTKAEDILYDTEVWFNVEDDVATITMENQDIDIDLKQLPDVVLAAFEKTKYSDTKLWVVDEVEIEIEHDGTNKTTIYEIDLNSASGITPEMEAVLYYDKDGNLLFSSEKEDKDDDKDDDTIAISTKLKSKVEEILAPSLKTGESVKIISAELDDNIIEVDAIILSSTGDIIKEISVDLNSTTYDLVEFESEVNTTWAKLDTKFKDVITAWYDDPSKNIHSAPKPSDTTPIEVEVEKESNKEEVSVEFSYDNWEAEFKLVLSNNTYIITEAEIENDNDDDNDDDDKD